MRSEAMVIKALNKTLGKIRRRDFKKHFAYCALTSKCETPFRDVYAAAMRELLKEKKSRLEVGRECLKRYDLAVLREETRPPAIHVEFKAAYSFDHEKKCRGMSYIESYLQQLESKFKKSGDSKSRYGMLLVTHIKVKGRTTLKDEIWKVVKYKKDINRFQVKGHRSDGEYFSQCNTHVIQSLKKFRIQGISGRTFESQAPIFGVPVSFSLKIYVLKF